MVTSAARTVAPRRQGVATGITGGGCQPRQPRVRAWDYYAWLGRRHGWKESPIDSIICESRRAGTAPIHRPLPEDCRRRLPVSRVNERRERAPVHDLAQRPGTDRCGRRHSGRLGLLDRARRRADTVSDPPPAGASDARSASAAGGARRQKDTTSPPGPREDAGAGAGVATGSQDRVHRFRT